MRTVKRIGPDVPLLAKRKRVAAYARVSKETDRLLHSLSAQVSHYSQLIQSNPEWVFAGVYADGGLSGTGTEWRGEYKRLIADCEAGKIDIVLVKSISRLARNTVDLLSAVRHLKEIGVDVWFEKERIQSLSADGEILLAALASFAQEEIRSMSENIKWSIRKSYAKGTPKRASYRVFGYRPDNGRFAIVQEEAEAVRYIFGQYIAQVPICEIARQVRDKGIKSCNGRFMSHTQIKYIIHNEFYVGDRMLQKFYVTDPLSHKLATNNGQLPRYYIREDHLPIISRETFGMAQMETKRRSRLMMSVYCFAGRLKCGVCGSNYIRCRAHGGKHVYWKCRTRKLESASRCKSRNLRDDNLKSISVEILGWTEFDESKFAETVQAVLVQPDGSLEFRFCDGSAKKWQKT